MAIKLTNTDDPSMDGVTIIIYGMSGMGKTRQALTLDNPLIIDAEDGLRSIKGSNLPVFRVKTSEETTEAIDVAISRENAGQFGDIFIDSLSEIAEIKLSGELKKNSDPRSAYPNMAEDVKGIIRKVRQNTVGKNAVMVCKEGLIKMPGGLVLAGPAFPGQKLPTDVPYLVDTVLALRAFKDEVGEVSYALQCQADGQYYAKDRSGTLNMFEEPDLGKIIKKIKEGGNNGRH